jgi:N-acetylglutamate synthase-like GNAT family acetyltransferase
VTVSDHVLMPAGVKIRAATAPDLPEVQTLLRLADLPADGLEEQFGDGFAVAVAAGRIVGVAGIEVYGADGLLRSAVVAPEWRGRGIGDALTRDRIGWARGAGLRRIYLLTTTAGSYFPRFGFATNSRDGAPPAIRASREFADACPSTALFMSLGLDMEQT